MAVRFSACPFRALAVPKRPCSVSSLPPQNRACGSPAHGSPPSSRHQAFHRATGVGSVPKPPSLRGMLMRVSSLAAIPLPRRWAAHSARGPSLRAVLLSAPSPLLWPPPTPAPLSPVSQVLCLSGSSLPARLPSGSRVFTPGAETGLSCSHDGCPTIPRPLRRRVLRGCTPSSSPRPWPSPQHARLGSRLVPCGWLFTTRQASLHAADWWVAPSKRGLDPALRPRDLSRRRRAATKAAWPLL